MSLEQTIETQKSFSEVVDHYVPSFEEMLHTHFKLRTRKKGTKQIDKNIPVTDLDENTFYLLLGRHEPEKYTAKTGAELLFRKDGVVINRYQKSTLGKEIIAVGLWENLVKGVVDLAGFLENDSPITHLYIPVAPIATNKNEDLRVAETEKNIRVLSRFCGFSETAIMTTLTTIIHSLPDPGDTPEMQLKTKIQALIQEIEQQKKIIKAMLENAGIEYSHISLHDRPDNYTVEFVERTYYEANWENNPKINTDFNTEHTTPDLSKYLSNPNEYVPVVRIIDFEFTQFDKQKQTRLMYNEKDQSGSRVNKTIALLQEGSLTAVHQATSGLAFSYFDGDQRLIHAISQNFSTCMKADYTFFIKFLERHAKKLQRKELSEAIQTYLDHPLSPSLPKAELRSIYTQYYMHI